ncbi:MAG: hypothetical protein ACTSYS_12245, partial [Promethearchaeota archaeon]
MEKKKKKSTKSETMDYYGDELPKKIAKFLHDLNAHFITKHSWDFNERLKEIKKGEEKVDSRGFIIENGEIVYLSLHG